LAVTPAPFESGQYGVLLHSKVPGSGRATEYSVLESPLTDEGIAAINADPVTYYWPAPFRNEHGCLLFPVFADEADMCAALQEVCDWFNAELAKFHDSAAESKSDPYQLAAELQKWFISIHPFAFDYNGRTSWILMNWALEHCFGLPPSMLRSHDDMTTPLAAWTEHVRNGSLEYADLQTRLAQPGYATDPVTFFRLEAKRQGWQRTGLGDAPFIPGELHDEAKFTKLHASLHGPVGPAAG
jgi:hypothetical protein